MAENVQPGDLSQLQQRTRRRIEELRQRSLELARRTRELSGYDEQPGRSATGYVQQAADRAEGARRNAALAQQFAATALLRSAAAHDAAAEDLWGLRPDEAEAMELLLLDIGLPVADIAPMLQRVLQDTAADGIPPALQQLTAVNRRGKTVELQISASALRTEEGSVSGVILVIDQRSP